MFVSSDTQKACMVCSNPHFPPCLRQGLSYWLGGLRAPKDSLVSTSHAALWLCTTTSCNCRPSGHPNSQHHTCVPTLYPLSHFYSPLLSASSAVFGSCWPPSFLKAVLAPKSFSFVNYLYHYCIFPSLLSPHPFFETGSQYVTLVSLEFTL